jgi:hypothetical protein
MVDVADSAVSLVTFAVDIFTKINDIRKQAKSLPSEIKNFEGIVKQILEFVRVRLAYLGRQGEKARYSNALFSKRKVKFKSLCTICWRRL